MISLKEAEKFHGHLGPYLVLGLLAGKLALKKLGCKKYFGLSVQVKGANKKPKSCFIDGLQLSTGATYGKGNIQKLNGHKIEALFCNLSSSRKIRFSFKAGLINKLEKLKGHCDSELFARKLLKMGTGNLFEIK